MVQYGRGNVEVNELSIQKDLQVHGYRFKPSIASDIKGADLVISHAGLLIL